MSKFLISKFASVATTQLQSHLSKTNNNAFFTLTPKFPIKPINNHNKLNFSTFTSCIVSTPSSKIFYSSSSNNNSSSGESNDQTSKLVKEENAKNKSAKSLISKTDNKNVLLKKKTKSEAKLEGSDMIPLTNPACASLHHITPLDEHKVGSELTRNKNVIPPSLETNLTPEEFQKRYEKLKKRKGDNVPKAPPPASKKKPKRKMRNRLPELNQDDCFRRHLFAIKLLLILDDEPEVLENILWTDECNFNLPKIPSLIVKPAVAESEMLPQIAWCGMSAKGTIGPYFFNSYVTDRSYLKMLETYVIPELEAKGYNLKELWFQQDGARWHRSKAVLDFLKSVFDYRVISLGTTFIWPPHSQDLTPMDYFFWNYMKIRLNFKHSKYDLCFQKGFREILGAEVASSNLNAVQGAIYQLPERLELCVSMNGARFQDLLYSNVAPQQSTIAKGGSQGQNLPPGSEGSSELPPEPPQCPGTLLQSKMTDYYDNTSTKTTTVPPSNLTLDSSDSPLLDDISEESPENQNNDGKNKEA